MPETVIHFFMFFGVFLSLLIASGQLMQRKRNLYDYVFSLSFAGYGLWVLQISLYSTGIFSDVRALAVLQAALIPLIFLIPPVMVIRYNWIISARYIFRWQYLLLLVPSLLSLIVLVVPLFSNGLTYRPEYLQGKVIMGDAFRAMPAYFKAVYLFYVLPKFYIILFMVPTLVALSSLWKKNRKSKGVTASRAAYVFAALIVIAHIISITGDFVSLDVVKISILFANACLCALYLVTYRNPEYNRLLRNETRRAHYERTKLRGMDINDLVSRLYELMEVEKIFADEDLSLGDLAAHLGISPHQLSEILNEKLKKNFNAFVNEYRVNEARELLVEEPDRTIISVCAAAGFNSTTTFNAVFSRQTGYSPRQYRKKYLKN